LGCFCHQQGWAWTPTGEEVADNTVYYLYNVGVQKYLSRGGTGTLCAVLDSHGLGVTATASGTAYTFKFTDSNLFLVNTNGTIKADGSAGDNWTLTETDATNHYYTLQNSATTTTYLGADATGATVVNTATTVTDNEKWILVSQTARIAGLSTATNTNGVDATFLLVNPRMDKDAGGWTYPGGWAGNETNLLMEHFSTPTFDTYQKITNLPLGKYTVKIQGFYRDGDANTAAAAYNAGTYQQNALLYANTSTSKIMPIFDDATSTALHASTLSATINGSIVFFPNLLDGTATYFDNGKYTNNSVTGYVSDGNLQIGVKKNIAVGGDWCTFDNFELTYYGIDNADISAHLAAEKTKANDALTNSTYTVVAGQVRTDLQNLYNQTPTDNTAMIQLANNIDDAIITYEAALPAYQALSDKIAEADKISTTLTTDAKATLTSTTATVSDVETATATLTNSIKPYLLANASATTPYDMTEYYLTNPKFASNDGWTIGTGIGGSVRLNEIEFYSNVDAQFSISQTLSSLPEGYYLLKVQGFQRPEFGYNDAKYKNGTEEGGTKLFADVYATDNTTISASHASLLQSLYSCPKNTEKPNDMEAASRSFTNNYYDDNCVAFHKTSTDGNVVVGVRNPSMKTTGGYWNIFTNFRLIYYGNNTTSATIEADNVTADYVPQAATGTVTYDRSLKTSWNTLCLPFDVPNSDITSVFGTGVTVANLNYIDDQYNMYFTTKNPQIKANVPCLIKLSAEASTFNVPLAIVSATGAGSATYGSVDAALKGNYANLTDVLANAGTGYAAYIFGYKDAVTKLYKVGSNPFSLKPTRAYYKVPSTTEAKQFSVSIDNEETTGIDLPTSMELQPQGDIYNLNGQLIRHGAKSLNSLQKGIYIAGGKKFVVK
jgi:hypothetical protein